MKKIMIVAVLLISAITTAQKSLFKNISTTDEYTEYGTVVDTDNDGVYEIGDRQYVMKFKLKTLPTGEGYSITATIDKGDKKGKKTTIDVVEGNFTCKGYPYESVIRYTSKKDGIVAIGDYIFFLKGVSADGTSYTSIDDVYIKKGASSEVHNDGKQKKKKLSFKDKLKKLKSGGIVIKANYGSEHKALQSQNLRKLITDYLVAMKAKQDARTAKEKQSDKNISNSRDAIVLKEKESRNAEKAKRDAEWADAKRYNDSVKATPEWQDLQRRKEQNERNYQGAKSKNTVTLRNNSGRAIYVGTGGSRNPGTKINAGSTASWSCSQDAYLQIITKSGGSNAYSSTSQKVYSKNSGCGNTVNIN
ncbi:MAG: hypothetical protein V3U92_13625 [Cellulophaga sp.]